MSNTNFNGHCLINNNIDISKKAINLYISDILNPWWRNLNTDFTLKNFLSGSVKLPENVDPDKNKYGGYIIGFGFCSEFPITNRSMGKNITVFGADISSYVHINNKNKDILILSEGPTQGLDDTSLAAEAKYPINFTQPRKRFVLSLHYNGNNSFLFVNTAKINLFKGKYCEIKDYTLCLGSISKDFTTNKSEKNRIKKKCNFSFYWF